MRKVYPLGPPVIATLGRTRLAVSRWQPLGSAGSPTRTPRPGDRLLPCCFREEWWHHQFASRDLAVIEHD